MIGAMLPAARAAAAVLIGLLILTIGVDAFGTSRVDDRRAQARYDLLHPARTSLGDVSAPTMTGAVVGGAAVGGP